MTELVEQLELSKQLCEKYPNILCDNSRVFIPVNTRRKTHNYVREHIFGIRKDCVIITINGIDKNIKLLNEYKK